MPYLHLPFQSGADRILAAMNRKHTAPTTSASSPASAPPGPTWRSPPISSSASPARRKPSSRRRSTVVERVGFAQAYSFKYSPRPGTPGAQPGRPGARRGQDRAAAPPAGLARPAANGVQFSAASARSCRCCSSGRAAIRASSSAARPTCKRFTPRADFLLLGRVVEVAIAAAGPNSLSGRLQSTGS